MAERPRLLIVDDDRGTAMLHGRMLHDEGFDTEVELDGGAALDRLAQEPGFDVVITDFHIPGADGLAVATRARSSRATIPIFVVTGDPRAVARAHRSLDEPVEVVTKPVDYSQLVRHLHAAVEDQASWRASNSRRSYE
jgi:two-component system response regulator MprA